MAHWTFLLSIAILQPYVPGVWSSPTSSFSSGSSFALHRMREFEDFLKGSFLRRKARKFSILLRLLQLYHAVRQGR